MNPNSIIFLGFIFQIIYPFRLLLISFYIILLVRTIARGSPEPDQKVMIVQEEKLIVIV